MVWIILTFLPMLLWGGLLIVPWHPWRVREVLDAAFSMDVESLTDVTVLIPARDEARYIGRALDSVRAQGPGPRIILVDDQSMDDTARVAARSGGSPLTVIEGALPPPGWSGKLWALEQGRRHVRSEWILLLDADIQLDPGILRALLLKAKTEDLQLVSLMARLRMKGFWERLLMPAFIYFFKLLYPFRLSNTPSSRVAAAAGGCILLKTAVLHELRGFGCIRDALIDDCALAGAVKSSGGRTWIGLSHSVKSLRTYDSLSAIGHMVTRTAFYQLRYSALLLCLLTLGMTLMFWVPVAGLAYPSPWATLIAVMSLCAMTVSYLPILQFYGLPFRWAGALPLIGTIYLVMTWMSAIRFWRGEGARWKGRSYDGTYG